MAPWLSIFGDFTKDASAMYNNFRVYGTGLLLVMGKSSSCKLFPSSHFHIIFPGLIVFVGVKFVNKFAAIALACVILSIVAVYTGVFMNFHGNDNLLWVTIHTCPFCSCKHVFYIDSMCVLGKRLLKDIAIDNCTKEVGGPLWKEYCINNQCDDYFKGTYMNVYLWQILKCRWNVGLNFSKVYRHLKW